MLIKYLTILILVIGVYACGNFPYTKTNRQYIRQAKMLSKKIVLSPEKQSENQLPLAQKWVGHHMLNDYMRAWHGGIGSWGNNTDLNSSSIGIEIDNNGFEPFEQAQINSLLQLLAQLKNKYQIPVDHFIGHSDIAPRRKVDPNINFPWKTLANSGYGIWFEPDPNIQLQSGLTIKQALSLVGYETKDSIAAILAFKRHFRQDSARLMNQADSSVLSQLIQAKFSN
jgi:N-acetylmuramoyl-L-alanine amidase